MKKWLTTSTLCLLILSVGYSQTTRSSTPSGSAIPGDCAKLDETWSRIYLAVKTQRDQNAQMLADTTVALHTLRYIKAPAAAKSARRRGFWSGFKWGIGVTGITIAALTILK